MRNERGIALVITLLVVALLTITVVEFTYSVEIDQRMARNSLNGVQASLLARSGVVFGEAVLLHDDQPAFDAFNETWCTDNEGLPSNGAIPSCDFEPDAKLGLPADMGLRVRVLDEGGKFNLNLAAPRSKTDCDTLKNPDANQAGALQQRINALGRLLEGRGVGPELLEGFEAYWSQVCDSVILATTGQGNAGGALLQSPGTTNPGSPAANNAQVIAQQLLARQFTSLDDVSAVPGFDATVIRRLRPVVTATPVVGGQTGQVNVNSAPQEVLQAILGGVEGGSDAAEEIITQRGDQPFQHVPAAGSKNSGMLGVKSTLFLIRASAVVKRNPVTLRGGIGRTASMLVLRAQKGVVANGPAGMPRWTLTRLDWQKEGGAVLFQKADQDTGTDDPSIRPSPEG